MTDDDLLTAVFSAMREDEWARAEARRKQDRGLLLARIYHMRGLILAVLLRDEEALTATEAAVRLFETSLGPEDGLTQSAQWTLRLAREHPRGKRTQRT